MTSLRKKPDDIVDGILKRAELTKLARRLQSLLALARFKTKHGLEGLTLDTIEPNFEEEIRQKRLAEGDTLSDSAFSASGLPYSDTLMSLPLKPDLFSNAVGSHNKGTSHRKRTYFTSFENNPSSPSKPDLFSNAVGSHNKGTSHRKRTYFTSFENNPSSPSKRFRLSPTTHNSVGYHSFWKDSQGRAQPSPIKPCRQQHFTPVDQDSSFQLRLLNSGLTPLNLAAPSDDDDFLTVHSFNAANMRSSPLTGPPSTPPQNSKLDLLSSMVTPGDGNLFPTTPDQGFDFADFVNVTPPSPAQKPWRNGSSNSYHLNTP